MASDGTTIPPVGTTTWCRCRPDCHAQGESVIHGAAVPCRIPATDWSCPLLAGDVLKFKAAKRMGKSVCVLPLNPARQSSLLQTNID